MLIIRCIKWKTDCEKDLLVYIGVYVSVYLGSCCTHFTNIYFSESAIRCDVMQDPVAGSLAEWTLWVDTDPSLDTLKTKHVHAWKYHAAVVFSPRTY